MNKLKPSEKPHNVDNVVITCMDHRFQETIRDILMQEHEVDIDNVDRLAIGGPSKAVADGTLMPSLQIASESHEAKTVFLFDHTDCGGFGTLKAFDGSEQKEAREHFKYLKLAQEAVAKILPDIVVVSYVIGLDGEPITPTVGQ